jgi:hypothetical protein
MRQPPIRQQVADAINRWQYNPGPELNLKALLGKHPATTASVSIGADGTVSVSTGTVARPTTWESWFRTEA